jgi:hypothetical protein
MRYNTAGARRVSVVGLLLATAACASREDAIADASDAVPLTLRAVGDSIWEVSFGLAGKQTRFRVRPHIKAKSDSSPFAFTSWTLYPVAGSTAGPLLTALAKAHRTADTVSVPPRADSLLVDVALLGVNTARQRDGGFGASNTGAWIAAKIFLADGEAEVYFNANPRSGDAEFSVKDEEYGPLVLRELARILSG